MEVKKIYMIRIVILILICVFVNENEAGNVTESKDGTIDVTAILPISTEEDIGDFTVPEETTEKDIYLAECSCGTYGRSCKYVNGKKNCTCMDAYADRLGECTLCWCKGYSSMWGCRFTDDGEMVCNCLQGFAQRGKECKECDCGKNGKCSFYGSSKYCTCNKGYQENGGFCKECDCGTNGSCYFNGNKKTCYCSKGYREFQGTCLACDCGDNTDCTFNSGGKKVCACRSGYGMKDGRCTYCDCDKDYNCTFEIFGLKRCHCPKGFAEDIASRTCKVCDCGLENANCTLFHNMKSCQCPEGYEENFSISDIFNRSCKDINECLDSRSCPDSTNCVNTPGSYDCVCKAGYEPHPWSDHNPKKDGCRDIDECKTRLLCTPLFMRCINTPGSYRCECATGYRLSRSATYCERNSIISTYRPWRTASIVIGCLFGAITAGLLIAVRRKCRT